MCPTVARLPTDDPAAGAQPVDPFLPNLIVLMVLGVALSAWLLAFTNWFPAFGSLLALGGLFSWLGVVSKILTDERMNALQSRVDRALFGSRAVGVWGLALLCALVVGASFVGAVEVQSQGDGRDRLVWFDFDPDRGEFGERLAVAGRVRQPYWTTLWDPADVRVKVSGYPSLIVPVHPWHRHRLVVPASFLSKPVVLLAPASDLTALRTGLTLEVTVNGQVHTRAFDGYAVWIGTEADVEVPARRLEHFRATRPAVDIPFLSFPRGLSIDLPPDAQVGVKLLNEDRSTFVEKTFVAHMPVRPEDFPQVEALDAPM